MRKILLSLFISFISLIGFGYCFDTYEYKLSNVPGNFTNRYYDIQDSFMCVDTSELNNVGITNFTKFSVIDQNASLFTLNRASYNIFDFGANICWFVPSYSRNLTIQFFNSNYNYSIYKVYQYVDGVSSCDGSKFTINFVDGSTTTTNKIYYTMEDGDSLNYNFYYFSNDTPISLGNGSATVSVSQNLSDCSSDLLDCSNNYSSCLNSYNTLSGNYNTCLNDLSNCQNNSSDCSSYETDLLNCGIQLNTLSGNYNSCLGELNSCMSNSGSSCSGSGANWSALFINNIQHLGKPIINITIPEEINWDYNSTGDLFDLSVVGYNVDYDKINGIINVQNIKPTEEDFNKIVSEVVPLLVPGLFIIAFIYFVFRFIKKLF